MNISKNWLRAGAALLVLAVVASSFSMGVFVGREGTLQPFLNPAYNGSSSLSNSVSGKFGKSMAKQQDTNFDLFWDVWKLLEKNYVNKDKLSEKEMLYGAIHGLVASTKDPYTVFMDPQAAKSFGDDLAGTFEGIGAEIGIKKDHLVVIAPLPDSPAQKAGIRSGDFILAINGSSTVGMTTDEAVRLIRGPKDTEVVLNIVHNGDTKGVEIKIKRDVIIVKSVKTTMRPDGLYVVEVSNFNNDTEELFNQAIQDILRKQPKGIVLDLRNNPGGYLDTAIYMASKWIEKGTVVSERFSDGKVNDYPASGDAVLSRFKTVVLVNQGSASASEIVSGALQDYGMATIIGKQTFGKGSVQELETLKDGSSLKVTVAQWLTPKGVNISEKGIAPDKVVDLTPKDYEENKDPQLDAAIKTLLDNGKQPVEKK